MAPSMVRESDDDQLEGEEQIEYPRELLAQDVSQGRDAFNSLVIASSDPSSIGKPRRLNSFERSQSGLAADKPSWFEMRYSKDKMLPTVRSGRISPTTS